MTDRTRRPWRVLLHFLAVGLVLAGLYNLFAPREYQSSAAAYAVAANPASRASEVYLQALIIDERMSTYLEVAQSEAVLAAVIDDLGLATTPARLRSVTEVVVSDEAPLITFVAHDRDPGRAQALAAALGSHAIAAFNAMEGADGAAAQVAFRWVSPATFPTVPDGPSGVLALLIGALAGLTAGLLFLAAPMLRAVSYSDGSVYVLVVGRWADRFSDPAATPTPAREVSR